jgi:Phage tail tube protein, TTP
MSTVNLWKSVGVSFQSALGSPATITAITKANPGVASCVNSFSAGDYVLLSIQGMRQLDNRVVRVLSPSGSAFSIEGIDTTLFDTFSSGTATKITFGNTVDTATSMAASGGDFAFIDVTTIHQNAKSQVPGLANALTYTFDNLWDPSDAGQVAMKSASDAGAQRAFMIQFSTGARVVFNGYVGFVGAPTGSAQDKVVAPAAITVFGTVTTYAT